MVFNWEAGRFSNLELTTIGIEQINYAKKGIVV